MRLHGVDAASGRHYICAAVREARGTCTAKAIPAHEVESKVIDHLEHFIGKVESWIAQRASESDTERERFAEAVGGQRTELRRLQVRAQRAHDTYAKLLDAGDELAPDALRAAAKMDADVSELATAVASAEQRLEDWPTPPQVDAALDFYNTLRDAIHGRVMAARSVREVNAALRTVLEGAWLHTTADGLYGRFTLKTTDDVLAGRMPIEVAIEPWPADWPGPTDDDGDLVWRHVLAPPPQTEPQTFVCVQPVAAQMSA